MALTDSRTVRWTKDVRSNCIPSKPVRGKKRWPYTIFGRGGLHISQRARQFHARNVVRLYTQRVVGNVGAVSIVARMHNKVLDIDNLAGPVNVTRLQPYFTDLINRRKNNVFTQIKYSDDSSIVTFDCLYF